VFLDLLHQSLCASVCNLNKKIEANEKEKNSLGFR
jgi:hypothetical protein